MNIFYESPIEEEASIFFVLAKQLFGPSTDIRRFS